MIKYLLFLTYIISSVSSFSSPFNHWYCIDIMKNIDKSKPLSYNIGELPLVTWFNDTTVSNPVTTINICKHMGSKLDKGSISNGCLKCPYHGIKYTSEDAFGTTMIFEDKLWWSYNPYKAKPPGTPYHKNKDFSTTMFTLETDASLKDCVYNTLDINYFGIIYDNLFGQKNIVANDYKYTKHSNDKISLKYNSNILNIKNYQIFQYPYSSTAIFSLANKEKLVVDIKMTPTAPNKTKWIVTLKHNFWKSYVQRLKLDLGIKYVLHQNKIQMSKQTYDNMLKHKHVNRYVLRNEEHFKELNKMFKNFEYPDMISVMRLYNYHTYNYDDFI